MALNPADLRSDGGGSAIQNIWRNQWIWKGGGKGRYTIFQNKILNRIMKLTIDRVLRMLWEIMKILIKKRSCGTKFKGKSNNAWPHMLQTFNDRLLLYLYWSILQQNLQEIIILEIQRRHDNQNKWVKLCKHLLKTSSEYMVI